MQLFAGQQIDLVQFARLIELSACFPKTNIRVNLPAGHKYINLVGNIPALSRRLPNKPFVSFVGEKVSMLSSFYFLSSRRLLSRPACCHIQADDFLVGTLGAR
jgi:hypothetical protein